MSRTIWATCLLLSLVLAGCVSGGDRQDEDPGEPAAAPSIIGPHPLPMPDGQGTHDWLAAFVAEHPLRVTGTPAEERAAEDLVTALQALGYSVEVLETTPLGLPAPSSLKTIVATMPGSTMPDRWLAWGGHYDTTVSTIEGAYDNGSGTAMVLEVARMLADVQTNRTKAVLLFNGEEEGILASSAFVDAYEQQSAYSIDLFVGFDMVGLPPVSFFSGDAYATDFVPVAEAVAYDLLNLSRDEGHTYISPRNTRNSDEASFASVGIPTMRFAGLKTANAYWGYHKVNDTMETIHAQAGEPAVFTQGLADTAAWAYGVLLAVDVAGPPQRL